MILKRLGPLSVGKIVGSIYGLLGLVVGCIFALLSLIGAGFAAQAGQEHALLGVVFGVGAVIVLPLFYGGITFLLSMLVAALYNVLAKLVGGIQVELE